MHDGSHFAPCSSRRCNISTLYDGQLKPDRNPLEHRHQLPLRKGGTYRTIPAPPLSPSRATVHGVSRISRPKSLIAPSLSSCIFSLLFCCPHTGIMKDWLKSPEPEAMMGPKTLGGLDDVDESSFEPLPPPEYLSEQDSKRAREVVQLPSLKDVCRRSV